MNKVIQVIVLVVLMGVTTPARHWHDRYIPDSLAIENSPYISHVMPPQSYLSAWFTKRQQANRNYAHREAPFSSQLRQPISNYRYLVEEKSYYLADPKYQGSIDYIDGSFDNRRRLTDFPHNNLPSISRGAANPERIHRGKKNNKSERL